MTLLSTLASLLMDDAELSTGVLGFALDLTLAGVVLDKTAFETAVEIPEIGQLVKFI